MSIVKKAAKAALAAGTLIAAFAVAPASAAPCGNNASGFPAWLADFKAQAAGQGISRNTIESALGGVSYDTKVIGLDRNQKSFKLSLDLTKGNSGFR